MKAGRGLLILGTLVFGLLVAGCQQPTQRINPCMPGWTGTAPTPAMCSACATAAGCRACCGYITTCDDRTCAHYLGSSSNRSASTEEILTAIPPGVVTLLGERHREDLLRTLAVLSDDEKWLLLEQIGHRSETEWVTAAENLALVLPFAEMNIAAAMGAFGLPPLEESSRTFVFLAWFATAMEDPSGVDALFRPLTLVELIPGWAGHATGDRGPLVDPRSVSESAGPAETDNR